LGFAYRLESPVTWGYAKLIGKLRLPGFKLHWPSWSNFYRN